MRGTGCVLRLTPLVYLHVLYGSGWSTHFVFESSLNGSCWLRCLFPPRAPCELVEEQAARLADPGLDFYCFVGRERPLPMPVPGGGISSSSAFVELVVLVILVVGARVDSRATALRGRLPGRLVQTGAGSN